MGWCWRGEGSGLPEWTFQDQGRLQNEEVCPAILAHSAGAGDGIELVLSWGEAVPGPGWVMELAKP